MYRTTQVQADIAVVSLNFIFKGSVGVFAVINCPVTVLDAEDEHVNSPDFCGHSDSLDVNSGDVVTIMTGADGIGGVVGVDLMGQDDD